MKEINAFVHPRQVDRGVDALESSPEAPGVTASKVYGNGVLSSKMSDAATHGHLFQ